jgi:hypothetical protein
VLFRQKAAPVQPDAVFTRTRPTEAQSAPCDSFSDGFCFLMLALVCGIVGDHHVEVPISHMPYHGG